MKALILALATFAATVSQAGFNHQRGEWHAQRIQKQRIDLATSLVAAHSENYICDADAYTSSVVQAIAPIAGRWSAPELKNLRAKVAANAPLRENLALKYIISGNVSETAASLGAALVSTRLYSPGEGVFGSTFRVRFTSSTAATVSRLDGKLDDPKFVDYRATWSIVETETGFALTLNWDGKSQTFTLPKDGIFYKTRASGELKFEGSDDYPRALTTSPSECEV